MKKKIKQPKIVAVKINFDTKGQYLITKYDDNMIRSEPIDSEQASLIHADQGGY